MNEARSNDRRGKRLVWSVLWVVAVIPIGFALAAWTSARLLVPDNAGLAGGAMVLWYGAIGALLAAAGSIIAVRALDSARLKAISLVLCALAAGLVTMMALSVQQQQHEHETHLRRTIAMLPTFEFVLAGNVGREVNRFAYASTDNDWRVWRTDGARCRGGLPTDLAGDRSRAELLGALRGLDVAGVVRDPPICQRLGQVLATLDFTIAEHKPPATDGRLSVTRACSDRIPEVDALFDHVIAVYRRHRDRLDCR